MANGGGTDGRTDGRTDVWKFTPVSFGAATQKGLSTTRFFHFLTCADGPTDQLTDQWMDQYTNQRMEKASYRVACPQQKSDRSPSQNIAVLGIYYCISHLHKMKMTDEPVYHYRSVKSFQSQTSDFIGGFIRLSVCPSLGHARVEKWKNTHIRPCPPIHDWYWSGIQPCFQFSSYSGPFMSSWGSLRVP